ncbi:Sodium-dependent glucose transporter 1 [Aphelenchoides bicaudatus]|nr:Sodium-dependent glucose transporter 1 [Aphelenchoides bicaudatus]
MSHEQNSETEILARLGILSSTIESPQKMSKETRRRAALNALASSLSDDDSDSEIIFDRNALLNARKRRRRQRSTRVTNFLNNETLKWKLFCLSAAFFCMGLASTVIGLTKPDIMANVNENNLMEYCKIFVYGGIGYFIGSIFVSLIFTRVNAYTCILFLLAVSIPFTTLIIYQTQLSTVKFFVFCQLCLFGAIERGSVLVIYGILKGDARTLFMLYMAFAAGAALCSILTREEVFTRANFISQKTHLLNKREIASLPQLLNGTIGEDFQAVTRPHSAFGIDEDQNTKTRENTGKLLRHIVLQKKSENKLKLSKKEQQVANAKESHVEIATTTQSTTTSTTTTSTTTTSAPITFNRARNRFPATSPKPIQQSKNTEKRKDSGDYELSMASQLVYFLIMIFTLITVGLLLLGFCACCIRCNLIADVRVAQIALDASQGPQLPGSTRFLLIVCWFLQALPEAILIALLPHYTLNLKYLTWSTQNNTALVNFIFWLFTLAFKDLILLYPYTSAMGKWIKLSYFFGIPSCLLFHQILSESELGFFVPALPLMTLSFMQYQLDASPYLMTKYYFASVSMSKIFGPVLAAWSIGKSESAHGMMNLLTVILCLGFFVFMLLNRFVNPLARQRQLIELKGDINGQRQSTPQAPAKQKTRKGQYEKLMEDEDADVEMDYVLPDNILGSDSDSI